MAALFIYKQLYNFSITTLHPSIIKFNKQMSQLKYTQTRMAPAANKLIPVPQDIKFPLLSNCMYECSCIKIFQHQDTQNQKLQEELKKQNKNAPRMAWTQVHVPLQNNAKLKKVFIQNFGNGIRIGRMLEVQDYLSGLVAYTFCGNYNNSVQSYYLATICMDNFHFFSEITAEKDFVITVYPTWTSQSTIELRADISQPIDLSIEDKRDQSNLELKGTAKLLFAARDSTTKKSANIIPTLDLTGEDDQENCKVLNSFGALHRIQRKQNKDLSLYRFPPIREEGNELHEIYQNFRQKLQQNKIIDIANTKMEKNLLLYISEKNRHGKIFGGFIMRQAYELGFLCAFEFAQENMLEILDISDVNFVTPIEINSVVQFIAKVTFSTEQLIHVFIDVRKLNEKNQYVKATGIHITYKIKDAELGVLAQPREYEDAMNYLEAKRRIKRFLIN